MAAPDKRTLLRDAVRFVQKGQLDRAIDAYRALAKADPKDSKVRNELGDLYTRQGKKKEAIAEYLETASLYEKDGFALRAIALCQKILNLDPELAAVRVKLGDLYAGQRLAAEARTQYLQVANWFDRKGDVASALDVFRKIADLEPDNIPVRVKLAGMFEKQKFREKAAVEYARAGKGALAKGDATAAVQLFVRAYKLHPANADARRGIADYHRERKDWPVLVGLLQPLAVKGSRDTDLLVLYAEALVNVNHAQEAAGVLEKLREREPNSLPVNRMLGQALFAAGDVEGGVAALNRCVGVHLAENQVADAEDLLREMAERSPDDDRIGQRILEVAQKRGDQDAVAAAYLRLAGIYERKGLGRSAAGALEKYLELRPDDAGAAARLDVLREHAPPRPEPPPPPAPPEPEAALEPEVEAEVETGPEEVEEEAETIDIDLEGEDLAEVELEVEGEELEVEEAPAAPEPGEPATVAEAASAVAAGAPGRAAAFLEERLREVPDDLEAALVLVEARRTQGGGAALRDALLRVTAIHRAADRLEEARLACQEALGSDPRSSAAALTLAEIVVEEERRAKAAAAPAPPPQTAPVAEPPAAASEAEGAVEIPLDLLSGEEPAGAPEEPVAAPAAAASVEVPAPVVPSPEVAPPAPAEEFEEIDLGEPEEAGVEEGEAAVAAEAGLGEAAGEGGVAGFEEVELPGDEVVPAGEADLGASAVEGGVEERAEIGALEEVELPGEAGAVARETPAGGGPEEVELGALAEVEEPEPEWEAGAESAVSPAGASGEDAAAGIEPPPAGEAPGPAPPEGEDASSPQFWSDLLEPGAVGGEAPPAAGEDLDAFEMLEEAVAEAPAGATAAPERRHDLPETGTESGEIEEFLAEADFYFQQGLLDEAEFLYRKLLKLSPGRAEIGEQLARIDAARAASPVAGTAPPGTADEAVAATPELGEVGAVAGAAPEGDFADFLGELRQEFESGGTPPLLAAEPAAAEGGEQGLTEIFQEFQRSVREQLGEGDFETHYNLGIAYKEMGLMEEALGEFALAERSTARRADALSMVAICLREMGRLDEAAAKLLEGIAEAEEGSEGQKGFLYDLAGVHEQAGRDAEAQETLRRLVAIDPGYRDAAARVRPDAGAPRRKAPRVGYL